MAGISEHWERIRIEGACCLHVEGEPGWCLPNDNGFTARRHLVKTIRDFDSLKYDLSFFSSRFVRNGRHNGASCGSSML